MDGFPALHYDKPIERIMLWFFYEDNALITAQYRKALEQAGFRAENMLFRKGSLSVEFTDDMLVFTADDINRPVKDPTRLVLTNFPKFNPASFGELDGIDIDLQYTRNVPGKVLDEYIETLKSKGFVYNNEDDDYSLEFEDREYYFYYDTTKELMWSVFYY